MHSPRSRRMRFIPTGFRNLSLPFAAAAWTTLLTLAGCGTATPDPAEREIRVAPAASTVPPASTVPAVPQAAAAGDVEVNLQDQAVSGAQIDALVNNPSLRRLRLSGSDVDDAAIARLAASGRLELLDVTGCDRLTPAALQSIGSIGTLRNLRLSGAVVDDDSLSHLAGLSELAAILLQHTAVTDRGASVLAKLPKLKEVNLFGTAEISDASLETLAKLPALEKLRLRATGVQGERAAALTQMRKVSELDLSETAFGNDGMPAVAAMPALKQLNLWLTEVDDAGIQQLQTQTKLTSLNLDNVSGITDASLATIAKMPELTFLHLGGTSVTAQGLKQLESLRNLRTLIVTRLDLTPEQVAGIRQAIPSLTRLEAD